MKVKDVFEQLSFGELSSLSIGMEGAGSIDPNKQDQVVAQINTALTGIYTRFLHKRDFLLIEARTGKSRYQITPALAKSTGAAGAFILDTPEAPFTEKVIKLLSVRRLDDPATTDADETLTLGINARNSSRGVQILTHDTILIDEPRDGLIFEVEYQANHPRLSVPADLEEEITVMPALEEALITKVAARIFSGMSGETHRGKGQELTMAYEQLCALAEAEDMAQETSDDETDRLRDKGFV